MTVSDNSPSENLEDLDKRLFLARKRNRAIDEPGSLIEKEHASVYSLALRVGTEMVSALLVGVGIGYFLDYWLATKPWFLIIFFFLGAGAGVLNVYRSASLFSDNPKHTELTNNISMVIKQKKSVVSENKKKN